jgi:hypothetical protein
MAVTRPLILGPLAARNGLAGTWMGSGPIGVHEVDPEGSASALHEPSIESQRANVNQNQLGLEATPAIFKVIKRTLEYHLSGLVVPGLTLVQVIKQQKSAPPNTYLDGARYSVKAWTFLYLS